MNGQDSGPDGSREGLESALAAVILNPEDRIERLGNEALRLSEAADGFLLSWVSPAPISHFVELLAPLSSEIDEIVAVAYDSDGHDVFDEWATSLEDLAGTDANVVAVRAALHDGSAIIWQAADRYSDTAVLADTRARCKDLLSRFLDASAQKAVEQRMAG